MFNRYKFKLKINYNHNGLNKSYIVITYTLGLNNPCSQHFCTFGLNSDVTNMKKGTFFKYS